MADHTRFYARLFALITLVLPTTVAAAGGHVNLPFIRKGKGPGRWMSKRDVSTVSAKDNESPYAFVAEVTVGTPAQKMQLVISTSTWKTWVQDANEANCAPYSRWRQPVDEFGNPDYDKDPEEIKSPGACLLGSFNKTFSSSYQKANQQYDDFGVRPPGTEYTIYGVNFTDKLVVGDIEFPDMPMGLVTSNGYVGGLGLGYSSTSSYGKRDYYDPDYPMGIIDHMVEDDRISARAFSMWLDDADGKSGNLLFGAVDQSKFEGDLMRIQAVNQYAYPGTFGVTIDGLDVSGDTDSEMETFPSNDFPLGVTLEPGEVISFLPSRLYNKLVEVTGATYNSTIRYTTIPCDAGKTNNAKFSFRLSGPEGPVVNFETADLVVSKDLSRDLLTYYELDEALCLFGAREEDSGSSSYSNSDYYILGSSLLRRTFLTFDLDNREIAVAPVKFVFESDTASPTIVAFESSGAPVPSATLYCGDSSCVEYCNEYGCDGPTYTPYPTSTSDPGTSDGGGYGGYNPGSGSGSGYRYNSPGSYDGQHYWRNVAIGVGVPLGVLALIGAIVLAILFRRVIRGEPAKGKDVEGDGSEAEAPGPGPEMSAAGSTGTGTGTGMGAPPVVPPGTLPVIREGREDADPGAPQLPVLSSNLGDPMTPPEPLSPSNQDSAPVSAVSADNVPASQTSKTAAPVAEGDATKVPGVTTGNSGQPNGKGVEVVDNRGI